MAFTLVDTVLDIYTMSNKSSSNVVESPEAMNLSSLA